MIKEKDAILNTGKVTADFWTFSRPVLKSRLSDIYFSSEISPCKRLLGDVYIRPIVLNKVFLEEKYLPLSMYQYITYLHISHNFPKYIHILINANDACV